MPRDLRTSIEMPAIPNLVYTIDSFTFKNKDEFEINGWVYDKFNFENPKVFLKEEGRTLVNETVSRPDVIKQMEISKESDRIGFHIKYKSDKSKKATLVFEDKDKNQYEVLLNPMSFNFQNIKRIKKLSDDFGLIGAVDFVLKDKRRDWVDYDIYYRQKEKAKIDSALEDQNNLEYQPKISIIIPVYNIKPKFLRRAIRSVIDQTYTNWELCIADDCSTDPQIRKILSKFAAQDPRIKVRFREKNGHISEATNTALSMASGDYIGFMDDDDVLSPRAFYEYVKILNNNPDIDVIYCDEDNINLREFHSNPFVKPNWNPRLLLSHNYITHFVLVRKSILDKVGGFRSLTDGAQDYDLLLRMSDLTDKFYHYPEILYNWRVLKSSVAYDPESKNYAYPAGQLALEDHLKRNGLEAEVSLGKAPGTYSIKRKEYPLVSMILPFNNLNPEISVKTLKEFVDNTEYDNLEIIAVNFNKKLIKNYYPDFDFSRVTFDYAPPKQNSFELIKEAAKKAKGDYISVVKPGIRPINNQWLSHLMNETLFNENGLITPIYISDNKILSAGLYYDYPARKAVFPDQNKPICDLGYFFRAGLSQNIEANLTRCYVIKKDDLDQIENLEYLSEPLSGLELSYKIAEQGKRTVLAPEAEIEWISDFSEGPIERNDEIGFYKEIHPADSFEFLGKYPNSKYEYLSDTMKRYIRSQDQDYKGKREFQYVS